MYFVLYLELKGILLCYSCYVNCINVLKILIELYYVVGVYII